MDIMGSKVLTHYWLTNVNILFLYGRLRNCQNLMNLLTCADRDNQENSIHNLDCDRPSGMLHRTVWYQRINASMKKTVLQTFCYEQNVIRCHRNIGVM
jgi:hypothetical protein